MRNIKICAFLLFLFIGNVLSAGCTSPGCSTSQGINFGQIAFGKASITISSDTTFLINILPSSCTLYNASQVRVFYNGAPVDSFKKVFSLPEKVGHYKVTCKFNGGVNTCTWEFDLLPKTEQLTITPTRINAITETDSEFLFYPNPATNNITILNESNVIKKINVYNLSGNLIQSIDLSATKINLPLENYPAGIYILHIATLSEKIIVKKFTVL